MVVGILGVQFKAVRCQPHEDTIRTRQQSVAHRLDMFGDAHIRCVQDFKDAEARDDAGHCEGDVGFGTHGTPNIGMGASAEDRAAMRESAWIDVGNEITSVQ